MFSGHGGPGHEVADIAGGMTGGEILVAFQVQGNGGAQAQGQSDPNSHRSKGKHSLA